MIQWLLVLMMIAEGLAELTCDRWSGSVYIPADKDTCRASDINTAFNNGANLMRGCILDGRVSIFFCLDVTCALLPVYGEHAHSDGLLVCACSFSLCCIPPN